MSNKFFIGILVLIAVVFGVVLLNDRKGEQNGSNDANSSQATQHTEGSDKTGVVLIEYGDFECQHCWRAEAVIRPLREKYKDQITFQFRHFPLSQLHKNAFAAHRIAEAAGKQGKFWEMHDMLFEHAYQPGSEANPIPIEWTATTTPMPFFEQYAKQLGLDVEKLKADAASQDINSLINADIKEGQKLGISGTPAFVLDGVKIETPESLEAFSKLIDEAIKKKSTS